MTRRPARTRRALLDNGLVVVARENRVARSVAVRLLVRAGSCCDVGGRPGTASLVAALLDRGAGGMTAAAIADGFDYLGASCVARAFTDATSINARLLSQHLPEILGRLRLLVAEPTFPVDEVEREREKVLTTIAEHDQNTALVAGDVLDAALYPAAHPYHAPLQGTRSSVSAIGRDDLTAFHRRHYAPSRAVLVMAGDIDPARAIDMAAGVFGSWKPAGPSEARDDATPHIPDPPPPRNGVVIVKPIAGKSQADIALGFTPSIRRNSPELQTVLVLSSALGEFSLGGRLGKAIRDRAGLAYYAYSYVGAGLGPGPIGIRAGVAPDKVRRAVALMRRTVAEVVARGVSPAELRDSKQALAAALPRRLETNAGAAALLADCEFYGLGIDYPDRVPGLIAAVSRPAVHAAARRHLTLDRHVLVIAGPRLDKATLR